MHSKPFNETPAHLDVQGVERFGTWFLKDPIELPDGFTDRRTDGRGGELTEVGDEGVVVYRNVR